MSGAARVQGSARPPHRPQSWTEEEAAALYPEYAIGARLQLPFQYATAQGPSTWIWALGEVIGTASRRTTRDSRSTSNGTQPLRMTRRWGEPSNSGEAKTVVRRYPYNYATPSHSTSPAPSTRARSTTQGPCHSPRSGAARLLWFDLQTVLFLENTKIQQTPFCARSLRGAPIHTHFTNLKTKSLFKDIEVSYSTSFTATSISMLQTYSQTAVRSRLRSQLARSLRCCCSKP